MARTCLRSAILKLEPQSRFAVGVHLDPAVVTYAVLDLHGDLVSHVRKRTPSTGDPAKTITAMASVIGEIIYVSGVDRARLLGMGIASPGPIDVARGIVVDPPLLEGCGRGTGTRASPGCGRRARSWSRRDSRAVRSGLTVSSEAGGQLRVGTPWRSAAVRVTNASGATVPHSVSGGVITVSSAAGQTYTFARA